MEHKKQHFVPTSYLSVWCDPNTPPQQTPYVWIFTKDGTQSDNKAPHNMLYETDTYTIKSADGSRDLRLERGLCELESRFVRIRDKKISKEESLNQEEHFYLCAFMAAMLARTKAQREHHRAQWGEIKSDMDKMIEIKKKENPNARIVLDRLPEHHSERSLAYSDVREAAENPLQTLMFPLITAMIPKLLRLDYVIFTTDDVPGFITSDNPCIWNDHKWQELPPILQNQPVLRKSTEISLPISPRQMICLNLNGMQGYIKVNEIVNEANARTRFNALEYFVVSSNVKKDEWFVE
ncbi:MAG: DUF4238 domain-containing protein [Proteobacteria bacterium]|nr:DUF4238 domain-containing protein [Pseudomonadota bacterium]